MRRVLSILAPPLVILLILGAVVKLWALPQIEDWVLGKLKGYSASNLPVTIEAKKLKFHLLKPSADLEDITLSTHQPSDDVVNEIHIQSASAHLDIFQLFIGQVHISTVVLNSLKTSVNLDPLLDSKGPAKPLPLKLVFEWLEKIPLDRILISETELELKSKKYKTSGLIKNGDLFLSNHRHSIAARLELPELLLSMNGSEPVALRIHSSVVLERTRLKILGAKVYQGSSSLAVKGSFEKFETVTIHPTAQLEATGDLQLDKILHSISPLLTNYKLPPIHGEAKLNVKIGMDGLDKLSGTLDAQTNNISIDSFVLGNATVQGIFKGKNLSFSAAEFIHPAGKAQLLNTDFQLDENLSFHTHLKVQQLDLQKLFVSLNLHEIPVWVNLRGELPCQGQFKLPFKITCEGSIDSEDLLVTSSHKNKSAVIVDIPKLSAKGSTEITDSAVTYKAQLTAGNNNGESSGIIEYSKGFEIKYKTPRLDFTNIRNLANLKFVGSSSIEGETKGNSHAATFDMKLKAQELSFENYYLGQVGGYLYYKSGHLRIDEISGLLSKSSYHGSIDVNLRDSRILGRVKAPTLELADLASVFENKYHFPIEVQGSGSADLGFSGPFSFWKMSYQLDGKVKNIQLGGETFDELNLNVQATEGQLTLQNAILKKSTGQLTATGSISPEQNMNIKLEGRNFRLDESDFINKISSNIFGILNFSSQLRGKVTEPEMALRGSVTETVLDEQEIPSSFFDLKIRRTGIDGNANFFGHRIQADWIFPFDNSPLRLRLKTVDWNYASMFSIIGGTALQNEYDSSLTTDIDLRSESGQWKKVSGSILVKNLYLKRGGLSFRNPDPIQMKLNEGRISIHNFHLEGPQNSIEVRGQDFSLDDMNVSIVANTELRLYQMFFPFFDDIGGAIQTSATLSGSLFKPQIIGSLSTANSLVKIKGLPHPIERIQAEVNFSQTKILVNSIRGQMAGGLINAEGNITLKEYHDIPTSIRINLENVNLNIPDKVHTSGSAELLLSGKWFPFLMSGTYRVSSGIFEREFTDDSSMGPTSRQSIYLPKILRQASFEPLIFDIQVLFERSFLVKNSMVEGSVQGSLQVKGPLSNPILLGKIQTDRNTKLTFKDKVFSVQTGTVHFNSSDEINPEIYVSANTRVSDYDINLLAQGPAKNLRDIRLSSVPALSEQDIVSLLALGMTSSRMEQSMGGREQAAQTGYELGFAIFSQKVNKQFQDRLGLNVQFTSTFDSTRNISVPKMTLSRKVSNKVNASLTRTLGTEQTNEAKLQYLFNQNVSAIGSYQDTSNSRSQGLTTGEAPKENIFGLDLEFKQEFK